MQNDYRIPVGPGKFMVSAVLSYEKILTNAKYHG